MDGIQITFLCVIVLLVAALFFQRHRKKEEDQIIHDDISDISSECIENNLIPSMCLEDLDDMMVFNDSADMRFLIKRGYLLSRAVSRLHEIVAEIEPGLSYLGHVVLWDSKIKFYAGAGDTCMFYYKPVGIISSVLLKIEVDFSEENKDRLVLKFSGPLTVEVLKKYNEGSVSNLPEEKTEKSAA